MSVIKDIPVYKSEQECIRVGLHNVDSFPIHRHSYYEFELVVSGNGKQFINGTLCPYTDSHAFLLGPDDFHERILESKAQIWLIKIPIKKMPPYFFNSPLQSQLPFFVHLSTKDLLFLINLLQLLKDSLSSEEKSKEALAESVLATIILFIANKKKQIISNNFNNRTWKIYKYLKDNYSRKLSINEIAKEFSFNPKYLSTYFKEQTGSTITETLKDIRLSTASHLFIVSDKKIDEISYLCGYNSTSFFLRDFKKKFGISPTEMRKKYKK